MPRDQIVREKLAHIFATLSVAALCMGCSTASALESVSLQLKWFHQFQFAGYYAAVAQGYYRDVGLDVHIVEGFPGIDTVAQVVTNRAQYGVGNSDLLLARQAGKPVVVLGAIFQHSPYVLLARSNTGISSIHDLVGKRVMLESHASELQAYLSREGVMRNSIHWLPPSFAMEDLMFGRVDAISAYVTDEPFLLEKSGIPYQIFSARAAGIDFYGDNLFTSEVELLQHPDRVRAFRAASLRGWKYAMHHQEEVIDLILLQYGTRRGRDYLRYEAHQMEALVQPDLIEVGTMYPGRWQHIADVYASLGLMPEGYALDGFLYQSNDLTSIEWRRLLPVLGICLAISSFFAGVALFFLRLNQKLTQEMSARRKISTELSESERHFRFIAEHTADVIWTFDLVAGRLGYVSPAIFRLLGYSPDELIGRSVQEMFSPESAERLWASLSEFQEDLNAGHGEMTSRTVEIDQIHKDGRVIHTEIVFSLHAREGQSQGVLLGVTRDITARKQAETFIRDLAFYDSLTRLPNRRLLLDRLKLAISRARREKLRLALMFIDLDRFKPINDTFGHHVGDWLLKMAAVRMKDCLRDSDTVARLGGDEFVAVIPDIVHEEYAVQVGEKIRAALSNVFVMDSGQELSISSSIGIVFFPENGNDEGELLRNGDIAMYQSKEAGRNRVRLLIDPLSGGLVSNPPLRRSLKWSDEYAVGIQRIDGEHFHLFELASRVIDAVEQKNACPDKIGEVFDDLLAHVVEHFSAEEYILKEARYLDIATHMTEHARLLDRARALREVIRLGHIHADDLVKFLASELISSHILMMDRQCFAACVQKTS
jgi:diguanylate cyclase (GGDEF)-like protein/hemerythrin-like metal-binding protein/PAS domain S-box-containing protein